MAENYCGICFITVAPEALVVRLPRAEQLISPDKEREFFWLHQIQDYPNQIHLRDRNDDDSARCQFNKHFTRVIYVF